MTLALCFQFYLVGLIENWGTGTNRMIAACKNEGLPIPTFKESFGGILVTFKFKSHIKAGVDATKIDIVLTKRQQDLLEIIKAHGKIGIEQIIIELQETIPKRTLQKDLNDLKEMGLIALEGVGRGASWSYVDRNAHKRARNAQGWCLMDKCRIIVISLYINQLYSMLRSIVTSRFPLHKRRNLLFILYYLYAMTIFYSY